jgi:hypothetical protein
MSLKVVRPEMNEVLAEVYEGSGERCPIRNN